MIQCSTPGSVQYYIKLFKLVAFLTWNWWVHYTPVDRGLHSNPSDEFEDPEISKVKLELSDVYKYKIK